MEGKTMFLSTTNQLGRVAFLSHSIIIMQLELLLRLFSVAEKIKMGTQHIATTLPENLNKKQNMFLLIIVITSI